MSEDGRILRDIRDAVAGQNEMLRRLLGTLDLTTRCQMELLRQIHDAVTKPAPPSRIPEFLETLIALMQEQSAAIGRIENRLGDRT